MLQFFDGNISYYQIPPFLLKQHNIENEAQLRELCAELDTKFHEPE